MQKGMLISVPETEFEGADRVHAGVAGFVGVHAHAHGAEPGAAEFFTQRERRGHWRLVEGAYRERFEGDAQDRPVAAQAGGQRIGVAIAAGKDAGESGFALERLRGRNRSGLGKLGGEPPGPADGTDLVAPLVGAFGEGLQKPARERRRIGERRGKTLLVERHQLAGGGRGGDRSIERGGAQPGRCRRPGEGLLQ